jgi:hypothetical protein
MYGDENTQLVSFEKNNKNRINKKFQKLCHTLSHHKISFTSLDAEIKFLNQIYFLHQKINDLSEYLEETNNMIYEIKNNKNISKSFTEEIKEDNIKQQTIRNLATLIFLNQDESI